MRFLVPTTIDDTTLVSSSIAEDDAPDWDIETAYTVGANALFEHRVFESLTANTGKRPDENTADWVLIGPSNRYAMFDAVRSSVSSAAGSISVEMLLDDVSALSMIDVTATSVVIEVTAGSSLVYSRTVTMDGVTPGSIYLADLPASTGATVTVEVTGSGTVSVASLQVGRVWVMGDTLFGLGLGITDYSKVNTDEFGNQTFIRRGFSRQMTAQVRIPRAKVDATIRYLAGIRATPVVWIGSFDYASTFVIGFYKDFQVSISYPLVSDCSLTIEGITEHDDFAFTDIPEGEGIDGDPVIGDVGTGGGVTGTTGGVVTGPPPPPPPANVPGLLMHFDGNLADACRGRTFTADPAAASWTGTPSKFGLAGFAVPGSPVTHPVSTDENAADFAFGTGPFTIEFWVLRTTSDPVVGTVVAYSAGGTPVWSVRHTYGEGNSSPQFFQAMGPVVDTASGYTVGTWHHIAVCSADGASTVRIYKDGVLIRTGYRGALDGTSSPATLTVGSGSSANCRIDDLRVLPVEVYTAAFTPPTSPLGVSA